MPEIDEGRDAGRQREPLDDEIYAALLDFAEDAKEAEMLADVMGNVSGWDY